LVAEVYSMENAKIGSEIILTTNHPKNINTIGWTRHYKKSRVFYFQSGHDNRAFSNAYFRDVIYKGINWVAGRIYLKINLINLRRCKFIRRVHGNKIRAICL